MDVQDDDSKNQNDTVENKRSGREEFRDDYLDDLEAFRDKFEQMGFDVTTEEGEKNVFRWFALWRKEARRFSHRHEEGARHEIRFHGPEDMFKFIQKMHQQETEEAFSVDPQGHQPDDRHMDEDSRKRRDNFRKEWR
jgi:hypothetical protein